MGKKVNHIKPLSVWYRQLMPMAHPLNTWNSWAWKLCWLQLESNICTRKLLSMTLASILKQMDMELYCFRNLFFPGWKLGTMNCQQHQKVYWVIFLYTLWSILDLDKLILYCLLFSGSDQHKAALRLLAVSKLINQAVGDALSGLLLVEAILKHMGWSIHKWIELYQDLPSRQLKVRLFLDILFTVIQMV